MRKLLTKWSRFVVLAALLLSGCFRPAGDSIQPTSNATAQSLTQPNTNPTASEGAPPITLLSPNTPDASPTLSPPPLTEITLAPYTPTSVATESSGGPTTATLQIITPGLSLDLITPDTATPLPIDTSTPEGGIISVDTTESASGSTPEVLVSGADCTYTVQPGDNLYRIAVQNNTSVDAMQKANSDLVGNPPILQPGQVLKLPNCTTGTNPNPTTVVTVVGIDNSVPPADQNTYTVKPGDTLGAIATRNGVTVNAIMRANNLSDPNRLSVGQELIIPTKTP